MRFCISLFLIVPLFLCCTVTDSKPKVLFVSENFTDSLFSIGIEGPAYQKDYLYAVNLKKRGNIARIDSNGQVELFVQLPEGSVGNGIRFTKEGMMLVADYKKHNIWQIDPLTKSMKVFAHDDRMNQPNDLTLHPKGYLFAADPDWKTSTGKLWRIDANGATHLLDARMGTTNGVELSPDGSVLYVNESVQRKVWAYTVDSTGMLQNKRLFYSFKDYGLDGMRTDSLGNLYVTRFEKGTIAVIAPEGRLIREVQLLGKKPTNLTFGGADNKTVYVTMQDTRRIERFENDIAGRE